MTFTPLHPQKADGISVLHFIRRAQKELDCVWVVQWPSFSFKEMHSSVHD